MSRFLSWLGSLAAELKRRRIYHVASVYAVAAWVVLQVAKLLVDALFLPPAALTALLVVVLLGFPVAMVATWLYDLTPEGVERTARARAETAAPGVRRGVLAVLLGTTVLATAAAGWATWRVWLAPADATGASEAGPSADAAAELDPTRIAVLYFDDHSADGSLDHVAHGLTEAMTHELSQVDALNVVSRTAVRPFRDSDVGLDSIARALRAGSLVEGSVERSGDRLRATVQLVDVRSGVHVMSRQVERRGEDLLALRDEIVQEGARLLRQSLGEEIRVERSRAETDDSRAWAAFHRGKRLREDAGELRLEGDTALANQLLRQADSLFARAESLDPDWIQPIIARGHTAVYRARSTLSVAGLDTVALREGFEHAARALRRDSVDPEALHLRGTVLYFLSETTGSSETLRTAEEDLRKAVGEDASLADGWVRLSLLLYRQARHEEALWAARNAREADAFLTRDQAFAWLFATLAYETHELEEARRLTQEAIQRFPDNRTLYSVHLNVLAATATSEEDVAEAWRSVRVIAAAYPDETYPNGPLRVAEVLARVGLRDSALAVIRRVEANEAAANAWTPYYAARAMLQLGEEKEAVRRLERLLEVAPQRRDNLAHEWVWDPLRGHPGFQALLEPRRD